MAGCVAIDHQRRDLSGNGRGQLRDVDAAHLADWARRGHVLRHGRLGRLAHAGAGLRHREGDEPHHWRRAAAGLLHHRGHRAGSVERRQRGQRARAGRRIAAEQAAFVVASRQRGQHGDASGGEGRRARRPDAIGRRAGGHGFAAAGHDQQRRHRAGSAGDAQRRRGHARHHHHRADQLRRPVVLEVGRPDAGRRQFRQRGRNLDAAHSRGQSGPVSGRRGRRGQPE